jgi:hypothetical protein
VANVCHPTEIDPLQSDQRRVSAPPQSESTGVCRWIDQRLALRTLCRNDQAKTAARSRSE